MFKRVKEWLERLGDQNEKLYGHRRLDCCGGDLSNRPRPNTRRQVRQDVKRTK